MASSYFALGRTAESIKNLETVLVTDAKYANAHFALGAACEKLGVGIKPSATAK